MHSKNEIDLSSKFFYKLHNADLLQIIIQVCLEMSPEAVKYRQEEYRLNLKTK